MKLKITFYKPSGKYYTDGEVEIPDSSRLFDKDLYQTIMNTQKILNHKGTTEFYMQIEPSDDNQTTFMNHLFLPHNGKANVS